MLFSRKLLLQEQVRFDEQVWDVAGDYPVLLPQGVFTVELMGAGGAGGDSGVSASGTGGTGGGGSAGTYYNGQFVLQKPTVVNISVGAKGLRRVNGGNGGAGGAGSNSGGAGGAGGGGGKPSVIYYPANSKITLCAWGNEAGEIVYTYATYKVEAGTDITCYYGVPGGSTPVISAVGVLGDDLVSIELPDGTYTRLFGQDQVRESAGGYTLANGGAGGGGGGGGGAPGDQYAHGGAGGAGFTGGGNGSNYANKGNAGTLPDGSTTAAGGGAGGDAGQDGYDGWIRIRRIN